MHLWLLCHVGVAAAAPRHAVPLISSGLLAELAQAGLDATARTERRGGPGNPIPGHVSWGAARRS